MGPTAADRSPWPPLFVYIGQAPRTDWLGDVIQRDEHGFVLTGTECTPRRRLESGAAAAAAGDEPSRGICGR